MVINLMMGFIVVNQVALAGVVQQNTFSWVDLDGKKVQLIEGKTKNCVSDAVISIQKVKADGFEFRLGALHRFLVEGRPAKGKPDILPSEDGCTMSRTTESGLQKNEVKITTVYQDCKEKKSNREISDTWSFDSGFLNFQHSRVDARKSMLPGSFSCRFRLVVPVPRGVAPADVGPASGK